MVLSSSEAEGGSFRAWRHSAFPIHLPLSSSDTKLCLKSRVCLGRREIAARVPQVVHCPGHGGGPSRSSSRSWASQESRECPPLHCQLLGYV